MSSQTRPHGSATVCVSYAMSLASCDANDFACYCLEFLRQVITLQYCECCVRVLSSALLVKCVAIIVLRGVRPYCTQSTFNVLYVPAQLPLSSRQRSHSVCALKTHTRVSQHNNIAGPTSGQQRQRQCERCGTDGSNEIAAAAVALCDSGQHNKACAKPIKTALRAWSCALRTTGNRRRHWRVWCTPRRSQSAIKFRCAIRADPPYVRSSCTQCTHAHMPAHEHAITRSVLPTKWRTNLIFSYKIIQSRN